jgi:RNA polymerase sigma-70 factor (ECF subfamily)
MAPPDANPNAPDADDQTLLSRARRGDEAAFAALVQRYEQEVFHFLLRFVRNRAAADDLFQETFLQVHQSAGSFDVDRRFKPWLFTIAANKARDWLRRQRRRPTASLSAEVDTPGSASGGAAGGNSGGGGGGGRTFLDLMASDLPEPPDLAATADVAQRVRGVVDELPDHLREVILLTYFQKLAYKEVAEMLDVPVGTVKSRLHAAVGTFATLWQQRYPQEQG